MKRFFALLLGFTLLAVLLCGCGSPAATEQSAANSSESDTADSDISDSCTAEASKAASSDSRAAEAASLFSADSLTDYLALYGQNTVKDTQLQIIAVDGIAYVPVVTEAGDTEIALYCEGRYCGRIYALSTGDTDWGSRPEDTLAELFGATLTEVADADYGTLAGFCACGTLTAPAYGLSVDEEEWLLSTDICADTRDTQGLYSTAYYALFGTWECEVALCVELDYVLVGKVRTAAVLDAIRPEQEFFAGESPLCTTDTPPFCEDYTPEALFTLAEISCYTLRPEAEGIAYRLADHLVAMETDTGCWDLYYGGVYETLCVGSARQISVQWLAYYDNHAEDLLRALASEAGEITAESVEGATVYTSTVTAALFTQPQQLLLQSYETGAALADDTCCICHILLVPNEGETLLYLEYTLW